MASEAIAHSAFGLMGCLLRVIIHVNLDYEEYREGENRKREQ